MDPLVATVVSIIGPYLMKGAEQFAKDVGGAAFEGTKALVTRLSTWWSGEPVAEAAAKSFKTDPQRYGSVLASELAHGIGKDPTLASDLRKLVDAMGPSVAVVQHFEIGRGVTGADIGALVQGSASVDQTIRDAANVVGAKIDRLGGE